MDYEDPRNKEILAAINSGFVFPSIFHAKLTTSHADEHLSPSSRFDTTNQSSFESQNGSPRNGLDNPPLPPVRSLALAIDLGPRRRLDSMR